MTATHFPLCPSQAITVPQPEAFPVARVLSVVLDEGSARPSIAAIRAVLGNPHASRLSRNLAAVRLARQHPELGEARERYREWRATNAELATADPRQFRKLEKAWLAETAVTLGAGLLVTPDPVTRPEWEKVLALNAQEGMTLVDPVVITLGKGRGFWYLAKGSSLYFVPERATATPALPSSLTTRLESDLVFNAGLSFKGGTELAWHSNRAPKRGILAQTFQPKISTKGGNCYFFNFAEDTEIEFDPAFRVVTGTLASTCYFNDHENAFMGGKCVTFDWQRGLMSGTFASYPHLGTTWKDGTPATYDFNRRYMVSGVLRKSEDYCLNEITLYFMQGTALKRDWDERRRSSYILSGTLQNDTVIGNIIFRHGCEIVFHPDGRVREGVLAYDAVIDGVECRAGDAVRFTAEGRMDPWTPVVIPLHPILFR